MFLWVECMKSRLNECINSTNLHNRKKKNIAFAGGETVIFYAHNSKCLTNLNFPPKQKSPFSKKH